MKPASFVTRHRRRNHVAIFDDESISRPTEIDLSNALRDLGIRFSDYTCVLSDCEDDFTLVHHWERN